MSTVISLIILAFLSLLLISPVLILLYIWLDACGVLSNGIDTDLNNQGKWR